MDDTEPIVAALRAVADPCCRERGISVVDMGLLRGIAVEDGDVRIDVLLTSGWCPFQVDLVDTITARSTPSRASTAAVIVRRGIVRCCAKECYVCGGRMSPRAVRRNG